MKLVKATNQSRLRGLRIKELGRIANEGDTFEVTDERFEVLARNNRYRVPFVTLVKDLSNDLGPRQTFEKGINPIKLDPPIKDQPQTVEETPEIFVIEPNKEPVQVDENLEPLKVEEPVVEEAPKKKSTKKKKVKVEE
ncbi:MAG: hypothetical protein IJH65_03800 [Methanobrevibacter sp.]|nr:hypothetical protein [Methanobrevibacter sp.]